MEQQPDRDVSEEEIQRKLGVARRLMRRSRLVIDRGDILASIIGTEPVVDPETIEEETARYLKPSDN